jgi:hypothetical protein
LINLSFPGEKEIYYFETDGALIGPFGSDWTPNQGDVVSFQSSVDSLSQGRKTYDENDVVHSKAEGEIKYSPIAQELVNSSTAWLPNRKTWSCIRKSDNYKLSLSLNSGHVSSGSTSFMQDTYYYYNRAFTLSGGKLEICLVRCGKPPFDGLKVQRRSHTFNNLGSNTQIEYKRQSESPLQPNAYSSLDWTKPQSYADIVDLAYKYAKTQAPLPSTWTKGMIYISSKPLSFSIANTKAYVDSLAKKLLIEPRQVQEVHFGDLAMDASAKANANHVNMIAFLRDLRRPQDMIPKLRNLQKLRTLSGNYLAVNYGVLPTISDIQTIIGAFKKAQPYIDRHGFKTYNAVQQVSTELGDLTHSLEQRIKIAIDNEDSDFSALAQKVDSMGFALTLENVWDLIPYSFVIDWFIDIGGFLERADARMRLMRQNIQYATMSSKYTLRKNLVPTSTYPIVGTLTVVHYQRWTTDHCPVPPLSPSSKITVSNHWLEAGALITQRTKL